MLAVNISMCRGEHIYVHGEYIYMIGGYIYVNREYLNVQAFYVFWVEMTKKKKPRIPQIKVLIREVRG